MLDTPQPPPPHLPPATLSRIETRFESFRSAELPRWLGESMASLKVNSVSALLHQCLPEWKMGPRKIGDDMFFFILAGRGTAEVEGRSFLLRPGVCANFLRGVPHSARHHPRTPISVITVHYTATVFDSLMVPEVLGFPAVIDLAGDKTVDRDFHDACRIYFQQPPAWKAGLDAVVSKILLHLVWNYGEELQPHRVGSRGEDLRRLLPALTYWRAHLHESPPVGVLARQSSLSEPQFRRIFRRALGVSPVRYARNLRMERACGLLRTTDLTLEAIAEQVGYAEASFFATTFRQQIGVPPGAFRRQALA